MKVALSFEFTFLEGLLLNLRKIGWISEVIQPESDPHQNHSQSQPLVKTQKSHFPDLEATVAQVQKAVDRGWRPQGYGPYRAPDQQTESAIAPAVDCREHRH